MAVENTIKKCLKEFRISHKEYGDYLGKTKQAIGQRFKRSETKEEMAGFMRFIAEKHKIGF